MEHIDEDTESSRLRMSLRERPRADRKLRSKDELKFLQDFDPEKSNRERRKLKRKIGVGNSRTGPYDEYGHMRHNGLDLCDCLSSDCPGCWNSCDNCGSKKCGVQCRVNRKFYYESIGFDGKDTVITNLYTK